MTPAKVFIYTLGCFPSIEAISSSENPLPHNTFEVCCIKASAPYACWLVDFNSDIVYGAYLSEAHKLLITLHDGITLNRASLPEGFVSLPLADFITALSRHGLQGTGAPILDFESDIQSQLDRTRSRGRSDTRTTQSLGKILRLVSEIKQELVTLSARVYVPGFAANEVANEAVSRYKASMAPFVDNMAAKNSEAKATTVADDGTAKDRFVKAAHYQGFFKEYQWLEVQQGKPHMRNKETFQAALHMQVDKYLDRLGRKDEETQEMRKACFYLGFMIMHAEEGEGDCARIHAWLDSLGKKKE